MSLGEFGDLWDAIDGTKYIMIGGCISCVFVLIFVVDGTKYLMVGVSISPIGIFLYEINDDSLVYFSCCDFQFELRRVLWTF